MRKVVWASAVVLALVAGTWWGAHALAAHTRTNPVRHVASVPRAIVRGPIARGPNTGPHALLTFDDCPYGPWTGAPDSPAPAPTTPRAAWVNFRRTIATARRLGVALVLAPTGECESRYRTTLGYDVAAYARAHGMWVIGHSYDHARFPQLSAEQLAYQLEHSVPSYWVRPPYGAYDPVVGELMRSMGRRPWTWTESSHDFTGLSQAEVVREIVTACTDRQTCLLHMQWRAFNPQAIEQMVAGMTARGTTQCAIQTTRAGAVVATPVRWVGLRCDPRVSRG